MARLGKEWMEVDDNGLVDESGRRLGFDKFGRGRGNDDGDALVGALASDVDESSTVCLFLPH